MGINPLPTSLRDECKKAAKIFNGFVDPRSGLDNIVPADILRSARGFAIFSVVKAGFLLSARGGSGVVLAKLPDGQWSAPSAIGTGGLGVSRTPVCPFFHLVSFYRLSASLPVGPAVWWPARCGDDRVPHHTQQQARGGEFHVRRIPLHRRQPE